MAKPLINGLTIAEAEQSAYLKFHKRLYIPKTSPAALRTFNRLVKKGYARVIKVGLNGTCFEDADNG